MNSDEALDWFIGLIQGDFNEDPSASQIIVGAVITAIPGVGTVWDLRDILANILKLSKDPNDSWGWIFLVIALIGLIPVFGGILKGAFGIAMRAVRKGTKPALEALEPMLAAVRGAGYGDPVKYLKTLNWDNLATQVSQRFDEILEMLLHGISEVRHRWLFKTLAPQALLEKLDLVHREVLKLKAAGKDQIPKAMKTLRDKVDELLTHARPENANGKPGATTVIKHSERPLLRVEYEVRDALLKKDVEAMKAAGKTEHEIAEYAVKARQKLQKEIREQTAPEIMEEITARNKIKYKNPDGPDYKYNPKTGKWDYLEYDKKSREYKTRSKTDEEVTASATRSGGDDFPWDKVLEFNRAKSRGDEEAAARLLEAIKKSMSRNS